ncbi:hypothetical protein TrVE_jg1731 [Triparma verrucosa]|uniref:MsrB domain-containing protein n=2 Tax=Triparma TaxID=722752 RepID=A0A9W7EN08_9STRA|nr:hypothetical protein TrST_g2780 [Triparma strigata]GMH85816.1 hypothetical protein TrVE_jg1731 [Triparma verrucosa]
MRPAFSLSLQTVVLLLLSVTVSPLRQNLSRRSLVAGSVFLPLVTSVASASAEISGTKYPVAKTEREWQYVLSGQQYNILRKGGTEPPYSSILESEKRLGTFVCAGCRNPLFESSAKFNSNTGWPSFATALEGVEVTSSNPAKQLLTGVELKCDKCGGHLGDVFGDGFLFPGTPAAKSGKRHCIDGYAMIFLPANGEAEVFGDLPGKKKELPKWLESPQITPRDG